MAEKQKSGIALDAHPVSTAGTFATESVTGPYGITAEVADMHHVLEWQEFRAAPFQGYYRLILPPPVKRLQARIKAHFNVSCAVMYSSGGMALKELLEYLWVAEGIHAWGSTDSEADLKLLDRCSTLPFTQNTTDDPYIFLTTCPDAKVPEDATYSVCLFSTLSEDPQVGTAFDFRIGEVGAESDAIRAGVNLTNAEEHAKIFHERNRRRGACVAARDAARIQGEDKALTLDPRAREDVAASLCQLEQAEFAALYPSGMCAVSVALDYYRVSRGIGRFVIVGHPYSDTHLLCKHMAWAGELMGAEMLQGNDLDGLERALAEPTAAVIVETISNPLNEVPDLERIVEICRAVGVPVTVDNTMASPYNCQPLTWGVDTVIHSTAKYLSGANNHGGGVILSNNPAVERALTDYKTRWQLDMSPLEATVLQASLKDFEARMVLFNRNGLSVAEWLSTHPLVDEVYFAMLPENPDAAVAERLLKGGGSVVSFTLKEKGFDAIKRFYDCPMPLIKKAPSLGSNVTLLCPYTMLTYYQKDDAYLANVRLDRYLLRLSVGCEDPLEPVLDTIHRALEAASS